MAHTPPAPAKYLEIERELGEPLGSFVLTRRSGFVSWRRIAREVTERTGIEVSHEALRVWTQGRPPSSAVGLDAYVCAVVDRAPELTADQRARLAVLLAPPAPARARAS